jgi:hypothetical protein
MRKPEVKPLTSVAIRVRKDRDSLKTGIPMEIVRMLKLDAGSVIEWEPIYERRQVILKAGLKRGKV